MDGLTNSNLQTIRETAAQPLNAKPEKPAFAGDFKKVLDDAILRQEWQGRTDSQPVQFSKHANMRLNARQITLTGEQLSRVEAGLTKAVAKGIKDSLVLVDDVALVVNVKSKTVITALASGTDNVFSNIDGAVIV